jgi:hypothetical protein
MANLRAFPLPLASLAKRVLPRSLQRFLLLRVLKVNRDYAPLYTRPSRVCLEQQILPWVSARYAKVLFAGTASYTHHYEKLFRRDQYTTIDSHPSTVVWGAADHILAPIQDIPRHRPKGSFDCVILNGLFGFGVDTPKAQQEVVDALHEVMCPGGFLVHGWNTDCCADPEATGLFRSFFDYNAEPPWTERRTFSGETHVYDFYRRKAG